METTTLGYWLALNRVPGIGAKRFLDLVTHLGSPKAAIEADKSQLLSVPMWHSSLVDSFIANRKSVDCDYELEMLSRTGAQCITIESDEYPELLRTIYAPPPLLFVLGSLDTLHKIGVGIVGSRRCTSGGRIIASSIARELSDMGLVVISGMARGVDTAAHLGALAGAGETVAVLGSGVDVVYPKENLELMGRITERGAVVSEFNPGTQPLAGNFPSRNRIISGLSRGTLLVEAGIKSGALITTEMAMEQNREVMAVPGSPLNPMSSGPNKLIKQGAALVENASDICTCLGIYATTTDSKTRKPKEKSSGLTQVHTSILRSLLGGEMTTDEIVDELNISPGEVAASLTMLKSEGRILELPGKRYGLSMD